MMRKLKRTKIAYLLIFVIALAFTSSLALHSFAATATGNTDIRVIVDGRELSFDVPPTIVSGRTLVPLRVIFEALGAEVRWDPATKTVFGSTADTTVKLTINSRNAFVNGSLIRIDAPAMIIKGRTLVPTRFIAESLGTDVEWKNDTRTVGITTPKAISFQDPNLEAVIRTKIKKPAGEIKTNDVAKIDVLDASNKKISNLEGIQYFTSIRELNLEGNNIKEISKLATLKSLSYLYISKNQITDISPLSSLVNLKILMLWMNQISDISALGGMRGLEGLDLSENQVFDISPLKNLTDLQNLNLWSNPIIDISALKDHTSIKQLYLLSSSEDRIDQNLFDKFDQMQKKVKEITDSLIKPGMTD
ncbi:MAG: stalk domain-containing protein, partial [Bacillota bacterium]|nr:stalk domain-containing protein [Bacillota bacterium]